MPLDTFNEHLDKDYADISIWRCPEIQFSDLYPNHHWCIACLTSFKWPLKIPQFPLRPKFAITLIEAISFWFVLSRHENSWLASPLQYSTYFWNTNRHSHLSLSSLEHIVLWPIFFNPFILCVRFPFHFSAFPFRCQDGHQAWASSTRQTAKSN